MHVYFHSSILGASRIDKENADAVIAGLVSSMTDIASLWHMKYLPDDASVWINGDYPDLGAWVLADRSTHVRVYKTIEAGWARMNRKSVRFDRSSEMTSSANPRATFTITDPIFDGDDVSSTILVQHSQPKKRLQFIANSKIAYPVNGTVTFDPFTVIDLHHYVRDTSATTNQWEASDAMIHGTRLMTYGSSDDRRRFVQSNIEAFHFELDDKLSSLIYGETEKITLTAKHMLNKIATNIAENVTAAQGMGTGGD